MLNITLDTVRAIAGNPLYRMNGYDLYTREQFEQACALYEAEKLRLEAALLEERAALRNALEAVYPMAIAFAAEYAHQLGHETHPIHQEALDLASAALAASSIEEKGTTA